MADNIKFVMHNVADTATITGSDNISATLPLSNLQRSQRTKVIRTTDTNQLIICTDFDGSITQPIASVCLNRHNFSTLAQWQIQVYSAKGTSSGLIYDSGLRTMNSTLPLNDLEWSRDASGVSAFDNFLKGEGLSVHWFDTVSALSVKITISDPSNSDGYLQAGRLIIGDSMSPVVNPQYGMTSSWDETTKQIRSEGGTLRSDIKPQFRIYTFTLEHLSPSERGLLYAASGTVGLRKDWLVSVFPDSGTAVEERDFTAVVKFTAMPKSTAWVYNTYKMSFKLAEA